ncbi:MAG: endonuclease/exonuclease/phosphatase family protein [Flavobacteriaceae bacterium]
MENLFDTADDPDTFDDDYTPTGTQHWNETLLSQKIENLSTVIRQIGGAENLPGLDLLGVCETENATVLRRLVRSERLRDLNYGFIHFDSPDHRGIDVALLYKLESFLPVHSAHYRLRLKSEKQFSITTRDQLVVTGYLWGEEVSVLVNHWPSRRGGKKRSAALRKAAARLQHRIMDSLLSLNPKAKILMLGDFHDNPSDASLLSLTQKNDSNLHSQPLYNPMESLAQKGLGSLAYRDQWYLFDQILLSQAWLKDPYFFYLQANVFNPPWLRTPQGRYKGYPYRTNHTGRFLKGYSDHFPVYVLLALKKF